MSHPNNSSRPRAVDIQSKLVLLGESTVGKSSLVLRFVRNEFPEFQECTIGAAFLTQTVNVNGNTTVKFDIWDTAGQERYRSLAPMYYRGASAAVIVYDITSPETFRRAKSWLQELRLAGNTNVVMALVGNKSDLDSQRKVDMEEAKQYAESEDVLFAECSAKTGENVMELFISIAKKLPAKKAQGGLPSGSGQGDANTSQARTLDVRNNRENGEQKKCCS